MKLRWQTEWPSWAVLAVMVIVAASNWTAVPDDIPVHWNLAGEVDRYGGRTEGLLLLPAIGLVMYLAFLAAPRFDPARANYAAFAGAYNVIRLVGLLAVLALQALIIANARGYHVDMSAWVPLIVGPLMVLIGSLMPELRANWFMGIRTPWTLTSAQSWERTHRAARWVFVAFGLALMSMVLVRGRWYLHTVIGAMVVAFLGLVVLSYVEWRRDPNRTGSAGSA